MPDVKKEMQALRLIARKINDLSPAGVNWLRSYLADHYGSDGREVTEDPVTPGPA